VDWRYDKGPIGCLAILAALGVVLIGFLLRIGWDMGGGIKW
jgi:hypothetical protein